MQKNTCFCRTSWVQYQACQASQVVEAGPLASWGAAGEVVDQKLEAASVVGPAVAGPVLAVAAVGGLVAWEP